MLPTCAKTRIEVNALSPAELHALVLDVHARRAPLRCTCDRHVMARLVRLGFTYPGQRFEGTKKGPGFHSRGPSPISSSNTPSKVWTGTSEQEPAMNRSFPTEERTSHE